MIASCAFITVALLGGGLRSPYGWGIVIGLCFSWWGDLFLISGSPKIFLAGLIAFFLAHVSYCIAFYLRGVSAGWTLGTLLILAVPVAFILIWLNPHLGDMKIPVYAYMVIITLMVALAGGTVGKYGVPLILVGAVLFYVSDICVARQRFVSPGIINPLIGLPLYYAGQLVLAWTVAMEEGARV
jgi:uncharacterized membrane protein YhhN